MEYRLTRHRGKFAIVWYRGGRRYRYTLGTADAREARRLAPSIYAELTKPKGGNVGDLWDAYVWDKRDHAVVGTMHHTWKALVSRFDRLPGERVTIADCRAHVQERRGRGISDGTIHTELGHLRTVLRWAEKHGHIERAPHIERPRKPAPRDRHLTRDEARRLIDSAQFPHVRLFIILALGTGARSGALLDLRWDNVDLAAGLIDLRNPDLKRPHKGRAVVPINKTVRAALAEAEVGKLTAFVIEWAGKPVRSVKRGLKRAAQVAHLAGVSPHVLRHSAAVHMAEAGIPMEDIAQFLGHSNSSITRRVYARFSSDYLRGAAASLEYTDLRAIVPKSTSQNPGKPLTDMVGATGIEPVTPTMSTKRSSRK
jgi:integrase